MYVNKAGSLWGSVPTTFGRIFWVSPAATYVVDGITYSASNDNDGLSPERALRSPNAAWLKCAANSGDIIVLLPGTHTVTATIAANISGVSMIGIPGQLKTGVVKPVATLTGTGAIDLITIAASTSNLEFAWINLVPITAQAAITSSSTAAGINIHHCNFDMATPVVSTSTVGILSIGGTGLWVHDNLVICDGAQGNFIDSRTRAIIEKNTIQQSAGTWASIIKVGAATGFNLVRDNIVVQGTTATATVVVNATAGGAAGSQVILRNIFTANSNPTVDNFGAGIANIGLNFETDPGSAAGGTQVAAIT